LRRNVSSHGKVVWLRERLGPWIRHTLDVRESYIIATVAMVTVFFVTYAARPNTLFCCEDVIKTNRKRVRFEILSEAKEIVVDRETT
jgi:hypothetical protein